MINYQFSSKDQTLILTFQVDVKSSTVEDLKEKIDRAIEEADSQPQNLKILLLDFREIHLIDSMGLNLLVSLIKRFKKRSAIVKAKVKTRALYQIFLATRMDKQMVLSFEPDN